ncbi:YeeE/YedE family protein [Persicobacter diffluens]|uniref:YeeE/YedE family protein n=1 Tax=Persicobacter diffluens TaxID=981 RepID=A0AAN4W110_9BACT|nr:hypothetical protein PEDI_43010 [Persicobacter diffluens]
MLDWINQPWPWWVAGPIIGLVYLTLLYWGKSFGISATLRTACSIVGAGKKNEFFNFDWKSQRWNLLFVLGSFLGASIAYHWMNGAHGGVAVSAGTAAALEKIHITSFHDHFYPTEIMGWGQLTHLSGFLTLIGGGFLVGFGARYAGGCTSGHAISGLSNFQKMSLFAVIGFFTGGLVMVHVVFPYLLS